MQKNSTDITKVKKLPNIGKDFVSGLKKLGKGLDIDIRVYNGAKLGIEGVDGFYDNVNRIMYLDYNHPTKPIQATVRHEVIHVFRNMTPKGFDAFSDFVAEKYIKRHGEEAYNTYIENKKEEYAKCGMELTDDGAREELCADIGMDMMQNKEDVNSFIAKHKSFAQKLRDVIRQIENIVRKAFGLSQNITPTDAMRQLAQFDSTVSTTDGRVERQHTPYGYTNLPSELSITELRQAQELLLEGIAEYEKAQRWVWNRNDKELKALTPTKRRERAGALISKRMGVDNNANDNIKYSLRSGAEQDIEKALNNINYTEDVYLTENSPSIITTQQGVKNLPMLMKASHIRENVFTEEEAKNVGLKTSKYINYHGLGKELFLKTINDLDNVTLAYRGTKNAENPSRRENYFLLISKQKDADGNAINVPVFINEKEQYNRVFMDTNK